MFASNFCTEGAREIETDFILGQNANNNVEVPKMCVHYLKRSVPATEIIINGITINKLIIATNSITEDVKETEIVSVLDTNAKRGVEKLL